MKTIVKKAVKVSPMQKQFSDNYEEKRKAMFLYVAKELTGRAKQRSLPEGKSLDWEKYNDYFNSYYADYTADEILEEILSNCYWLATEQAVIDLYFHYLNDVTKANGNGKDNDEDEFVK